MEKVVQGGNPFVIMFVDDHKKELNSEKAVLKMADKYGIGVAKVDGLAPKYGINIVPTFVYFEDGLPSIFDEEGEELDNDPEGMEYRKKRGYIFTIFFFACTIIFGFGFIQDSLSGSKNKELPAQSKK